MSVICKACGRPLSESTDDGIALLGFCDEGCLMRGDTDEPDGPETAGDYTEDE